MRTAVVIALLLLLVPLAAAHLDAGKDFVKDGLVYDLGWSPAQPVAGTPTQFLVTLGNNTSQQPLPVQAVWVSIVGDDQNGFSSTMTASGGGSGFTYAFPHGGNYTIDVRFDVGNTSYTHTYNLYVNHDPNTARLGVLGLLGLILIATALARAWKEEERDLRMLILLGVGLVSLILPALLWFFT